MLPGCLGRNNSAKIESLWGVDINYIFLTDSYFIVNYHDQYDWEMFAAIMTNTTEKCLQLSIFPLLGCGQGAKDPW